ncbi:hypothetical protein CSW14_04515 [Thermus scotoductus]|uniref:histidine kinase n=1 Tax=Thermus scotoductus TaxID=37636 RepID=A0A430VTG6_THESC|nr:hypothetical protein CSW14_04515 [Thermus scotoductus]
MYAGTALLVLLLSILLARSLVARALEPLEWVARRAEAITARPEPLPEPEGRDEVATLVRALNGMLSRMQEAFLAQTRFLQDASHELRTPITAILGHVGYLLRRTPLTEAQRESLEIVKREAERMGKLVSDLLELSQSGTWRIEPVPLRVLDLLEEIREEFAPGFAGEIRVEADPGLYLLGDPYRLHQVLANLVTNAIKAKAQRITLKAFGVEGRVVVQVEDDGEGLPLPLEALAQPFRQGGPNRGSAGLGLYTAKRVAEAHGGRLLTCKTPLGGACLRLELPSAKEL